MRIGRCGSNESPCKYAIKRQLDYLRAIALTSYYLFGSGKVALLFLTSLRSNLPRAAAMPLGKLRSGWAR